MGRLNEIDSINLNYLNSPSSNSATYPSLLRRVSCIFLFLPLGGGETLEGDGVDVLQLDCQGFINSAMSLEQRFAFKHGRDSQDLEFGAA